MNSEICKHIHRIRRIAFARIMFFSLFCMFVSGIFFANTAIAATLSVSPVSSKISVGNIATVKVLVDTEGKAINNSDLKLLFPIDLLDVVSVSKSASVFSLWVEEPIFSNSAGTVTLNGGVPNPGFTGAAGEVVSVTFRAKKQGLASLVFSDSAVRENNGLGTDILTTKTGGFLQIDAAQPLEIPVAAVGGVPSKPVITSSSHPEPNTWYTNTNATFSWVVPQGVTSLQTLLGKSPDSIPTILYDSSVSQRTVNNLADGVLYFHLRYQNASGWGPIAHQKIQIDTTPPEKFLLPVERDGVRDVVTLNASDVTSGIDQYVIQIDDADGVFVKSNSIIDNKYILPVQYEGKHTLKVIAYDKAGNYTESSTAYSSSEIFAPTFKLTSDRITKGESVQVKGSSLYANTDVVVSVEMKKGKVKEYKTQTESDGSFAIIIDDLLLVGHATLSAQLVFSETIKSPVSKEVSLTISDTAFVATSKLIIFGLATLIVMLILIILLLIVAYVGWHKLFGMRKKITRDLETTAGSIHEVLGAFKDELTKQLLVLEKVRKDRDLNRKEEKIFKELKNNVDSIDGFIEKNLKKIIKP